MCVKKGENGKRGRGEASGKHVKKWKGGKDGERVEPRRRILNNEVKEE